MPTLMNVYTDTKVNWTWLEDLCALVYKDAKGTPHLQLSVRLLQQHSHTTTSQ